MSSLLSSILILIFLAFRVHYSFTYLLFTNTYLLFNIHYYVFTITYLLFVYVFTIHFTMHYALYTMHYALFTMHYTFLLFIRMHTYSLFYTYSYVFTISSD